MVVFPLLRHVNQREHTFNWLGRTLRSLYLTSLRSSLLTTKKSLTAQVVTGSGV